MRYFALALALVVGLAVPSAAQDPFAAPPVNLWITGDSFETTGPEVTVICGTPCTFYLRAPMRSYYALVAYLPGTSPLETGVAFWDGLVPKVGFATVPAMVPEYMENCKLDVVAVVVTVDGEVFWSNSYSVKLL